MYDRDWYIGVIQEVCKEEGDVKVRFMHAKGPGRPENSFFWPPRKIFVIYLKWYNRLHLYPKGFFKSCKNVQNLTNGYMYTGIPCQVIQPLHQHSPNLTKVGQ